MQKQPLKYQKISFVLFLSLIFSSLFLHAQDVHFSMPDMAPLYLTPALAGASEADHRFGAIYRDQWRSVPVPFTTFSGFYDQKLSLPFLKNIPLGAGLVFMSDKAGDGQLVWNQIGLRIAYHRQLNDENRLSLGINADIGQRSFSQEFLAFGDQYNGVIYDPGQETEEVFDATSRPFTSFGLGLNWNWKQWRSRTSIQTGVAANHLNQPLIRFYDFEGQNLPLNLKGYSFGTVQATDDLDATFRLLFQRQNSYQELLTGLGARYHLTFNKKDLAIGLGIAYRWADAFVLSLEGEYTNWKWGLAYDLNTSSFQTATNQRGGFELAIHYQLLKVKPPDEFKSCPIF